MERDTYVYMLYYRYSNFNSHAHVERDFVWNFSFLDEDISTHTLTWSVTLQYTIYSMLIFYFNSHAHVERDGLATLSVAKLVNFNSHAHVERDT